MSNTPEEESAVLKTRSDADADANASSADPRGGIISADVSETNPEGGSAAVWQTFTIPDGTRPIIRKDRAIWSVTLGTPKRVPARGHVVVRLRGSSALAFVIEYTGKIPTVRPAAVDTPAAPSPSPEASGPPGPPGPPGDAAQNQAPGMSGTPGQAEGNPLCEEYEGYEGYASLEDECWVQLNSGADSVVVQWKLKKLAPLDVYRDSTGGEYYVYGVTRFVVQVEMHGRRDGNGGEQHSYGASLLGEWLSGANSPEAPRTDREKVLSI